MKLALTRSFFVASLADKRPNHGLVEKRRIMKQFKQAVGLLVMVNAVVLLALPVSGAASVIVVPNSLQNTEGNDNNGFPFNLGNFSDSSMRFQQVFDASQFSLLSGPTYITQIAFRPDGGFGGAFSATTLRRIRGDCETAHKLLVILFENPSIGQGNPPIVSDLLYGD